MSSHKNKRVVLLGATGSIGESAIEVFEKNTDRLELVGIACRKRYRELAAIAHRLEVPWAAVEDEKAAEAARREGVFPAETKLVSGVEGLSEIACLPEADAVLSAISGTDGLPATLAAIEAGKDIALASKEILVLAGKFVTEAARRRNVRLLPVDSEHSAIFQCLHGHDPETVRRLVLTASGGPFLHSSLEEMRKVTPEMALRHPNWDMGPKITVDSATMANKGLEMIEAHWLFGVSPEQVDVVIHPQSIVHSLVEFFDGSSLAQLSPPSMTFAIQYALLFPGRGPKMRDGLDFSHPFQLEFLPPDPDRFPCLTLARHAMNAGGVAPAVFNSANQVAVDAFLGDRLPFLEIPAVIDNTLSALDNFEPAGLEEVLTAGKRARESALSFVSARC